MPARPSPELTFNPRPTKRARLTPATSTSSSPLTSPPTSSPRKAPTTTPCTSTPKTQVYSSGLRRLPPAQLLLTLPALLALPPTHPAHAQSLALSLRALRKLTAGEGRGGSGGDGYALGSAEEECRAWTALAEVGMRVIQSGYTQENEGEGEREVFVEFEGVEAEVPRALSRAQVVAQAHPSLAAYRVLLATHQSTLAHWAHKPKFARAVLKRVLDQFTPTPSNVFASTPTGGAGGWRFDAPPHVVYAAYLAAVDQRLNPVPTSASDTTSNTSPTKRSPTKPARSNSSSGSQAGGLDLDLQAALAHVDALRAVAGPHPRVVQLCAVIKLRLLLGAGCNDLVGGPAGALAEAERAFGIAYGEVKQEGEGKQEVENKGEESVKEEIGRRVFADAAETALALHVLVMGVVHYTTQAKGDDAGLRARHVHELLDADALGGFKEGIIEISLEPYPPLYVRATHPRVLWHLVYLLGATSKRDAVGRKPRRKVWAVEGLLQFAKMDEDRADKEGVKGEGRLERECGAPGVVVSTWGSGEEIREVEGRLERIRAELMLELVTVSIMRSEFAAAQTALLELIAFVRGTTPPLWDRYAARIALAHAHLAHALGDNCRAEELYRVAEFLADPDQQRSAGSGGYGGGGSGETEVYACARVGSVLLAVGTGAAVREGEVREVARVCKAGGGLVGALGHLVEAAACGEDKAIVAKQHLKRALDLASGAGDNYLRALVLALIAAHYVHTAEDHALGMLRTCEQLAAGLGAQPKAGGAKQEASSSSPSKDLSSPTKHATNKHNNHVSTPKQCSSPPSKEASEGRTHVGNAPLGLWVGARMLEIMRRFWGEGAQGWEAECERRAGKNEELGRAVEAVRRRAGQM